MLAYLRPRVLRRTLIKRGFERRGPWLTGFEIDGQWYGGEYDYRDDGRVRLFFERFPDARRVLELGSFEGGHSFMLARRVDEVIAVEVREESITRAEYVRKLLRVRNVRFVQANLELVEPAAFGRFDTIFCSGLIYHLPRPWELLSRLADAAPRAWIWTQYAPEAVAKHDGWEGSWYTEGGLSDALSGVSPRSFWLTLGALEHGLREGGYDDVEIVAREKNQHGHAVLLAATTSTSR